MKIPHIRKAGLREAEFDLATAVNVIIDGGLNTVNSFTLASGSATSTTISDPTIKRGSILIWSPKTSHAAGFMGNLYADYTSVTVTGGSVTVKHSACSVSDASFNYVVHK